MSRAKTVSDPYAKRSGENDQQWKLRVAMVGIVNPEKAERQVANDFTAQHGDYRKRFVTHVETNTRAQVHLNRSSDMIERWKHKGKLTDPQIAAIDMCLSLWRRAGISQRTTANYGERIGGIGQAEHRALGEIEARQDLHRIQNYVPMAYWDVFENIARHTMPVGEAAAIAGYTGTGAEIRAHTVVCFVADVIAMRERL